MEHSFAQPEDFLADDSFIAWADRTDAEAIRKWEAWLIEHPDKKPIFLEAVLLFNLMKAPESLPAAQVESAYENLQSALSKTSATTVPFYKKYWFRSVAALLILAFSIWMLWPGSKPQQGLQTHFGELAKQQLPDGTEIVLNANSVIKYGSSKHFEREVWLSGEGLFHVAKTADKRRFIVHASHFDIIVTGTTFNVTDHDGLSSVVLKEGSVIIKTTNGDTMQMVPGDRVEFKDNLLQKTVVEPETFVAWTEQKIIFDKTPISEVVKMINRYYGVEVTLRDSMIANKTLSGVLPNNNLDVLLKSLEALHEFSIRKEKNKVIIQARDE